MNRIYRVIWNCTLQVDLPLYFQTPVIT
ncbi:ESPR-type extended signal peptide-containing protein [Escherichia coli]